MADSKMSACPVMSRYMTRYRHYLDSPIMWSRWSVTEPYWNRYHHEFERMRTSMLVQQDLIDEMLSQIRASRASRAEQSSRISCCEAKCETITRSLREDSRSISAIESEISAWQSAVSDMHATMSTLKSRTESMGSKIKSLKSDFDETSRTLKTEFNVQSLLTEMEEKRKRAEEECQRIYDTLKLTTPKVVQSDTWCPICKSDTCVYSSSRTQTPSPPPQTPPPPPPANICPICGAEDCQYGKNTRCKVCNATDCKYMKIDDKTERYLLVVEDEPEVIVEPESEPEPEPEKCDICGSESCTYETKETKEHEEPVLDMVAPPWTYEPEIIEITNICEICGAENCTYGEKESEPVCAVCFKENCPYFVKGSF